MSTDDKPVNQLFSNNKYKNILLRSAKHDMSSKIVGWFVEAWDGKNSD